MRLLSASDRLRIVVLGFVVRGPLGGMAWSNLHYFEDLWRKGDYWELESSPFEDARYVRCSQC